MGTPISDNHTTHLQDGFHDAPTFQADLCAGRSFKDSFPFDRRPSPIIPQQQTRQLVLHVEEYDARYDTYESEICIQAEQDVYAAAGCASSWWKLDTEVGRRRCYVRGNPGRNKLDF